LGVMWVRAPRRCLRRRDRLGRTGSGLVPAVGAADTVGGPPGRRRCLRPGLRAAAARTNRAVASATLKCMIIRTLVYVSAVRTMLV
jgi:hypothetical protein